MLNIGLEGCMTVGALAAYVAGTSGLPPELALVAGLGAGLAAALLSGLFSIALAVDSVVAGTAVNLLAQGGARLVYEARNGGSGALLSLPTLTTFAGVDAGLLLVGLSLAMLLWILRTRGIGLLARAAGESPSSVAAAGFSARRVRLFGLLVSGGLAGIGGAYLVVGTTGAFQPGVGGRGFVALAMVTFGRWRPAAVLGAALLVGALEIMQFRAQSWGLSVPYQWLAVLPYVVTLLVLLAAGRGSVGPAALGGIYRGR